MKEGSGRPYLELINDIVYVIRLDGGDAQKRLPLVRKRPP